MANQNPLATNLTLEQQKNLFGNAYLNMLWHCPTDLRFHYWVHLPDYYYCLLYTSPSPRDTR